MSFLTFLADAERLKFGIDVLDTHNGLPHVIRRNRIFNDVVALFRDKREIVLKEFPLRIKYANEKAVDTGGVCRDMLSAFWQEAYVNNFGGRNVVPIVHPHSDMQVFEVFGVIFSHGYINTGFLPVRVAFPSIAAAVYGTNVCIPEEIMIESFQCYLSFHESGVLRKALSVCGKQSERFPDDLTAQLISILSHFGCRENPQPSNLKQLIVQLGQHEFITKPLGALQAFHNGIPSTHHQLWNQLTVKRLFALYNAMNATPQLVLEMLLEPILMAPDEQRVFSYLTSFIGNSAQEELKCFLRFVTGSSSVTANKITVSFNNLSGVARRPISHTCGCFLKLSTDYLSYIDFANEFDYILRNSDSWAMDAI